MNIAILLSGGVGRRMGLDIPKQYIRISGKMLITYCLENLLCHPMIDAVQIAAADEWRESILDDARDNNLDIGQICGFSDPGTNRQLSVFHALKDIKTFAFIRGKRFMNGTIHDNSAVLIHDAVRPNLSVKLITACFKALKKHDGVMPVLPMKDTVYLSADGGRVSKLLDRDKIFAGQAPEVFNLDRYYEANLRLFPYGLEKIKGSTEPAVLAGLDIAMIAGEENNFKITTPQDLERFRSLVSSGILR